MWRCADKRNKKIQFISLLAVFGLCVTLNACVLDRAASAQGGSTVGAVICEESSQITLTKPVSDSVVTTSTVTLEGSVDQAGQIEIKVDGMYDSTIPLSIGQKSFTGFVQLEPGTHTITITAINICQGENGVTEAVVTYQPSPQAPSKGVDTPTTVGGMTEEALLPTDMSAREPLGVIEDILEPIGGLADWLNIDLGGGANQELSRLSVGQALALTAGMYLAIIGLAPVVLTKVAAIPFVASRLSVLPASRRMTVLSRGVRVLGAILIIWILFFS